MRHSVDRMSTIVSDLETIYANEIAETNSFNSNLFHGSIKFI